MFGSSAGKVLCLLPLVPSVNMTVVMFSLPVPHLFQFDCLLGGTVSSLYTEV